MGIGRLARLCLFMKEHGRVMTASTRVGLQTVYFQCISYGKWTALARFLLVCVSICHDSSSALPRRLYSGNPHNSQWPSGHHVNGLLSNKLREKSFKLQVFGLNLLTYCCVTNEHSYQCIFCTFLGTFLDYHI